MNPYLRNESEAEEFDNTVDVALKLFARSKKRRQMAEKDLLTLGARSVRPTAYTIELALWDKSMSDDDINERGEDVSDIILGFLLYSKEDKNILICPTCGSRIPAQKKSDSGDE